MNLDQLVFVDFDELLEIHAEALRQAGGADGVRDRGLLQSALAAPQRSAFGELAYPTLAKMAAALAYGLARNHGFVDGNKRAAHMTSRVFLEYNGYPMAVPPDWAEIIEAVAAGTLDQDALAQLFAGTIGGDIAVSIDSELERS